MNPEITKIKRAWTTKQSLIVALICFIVGLTVFIMALSGASADSLLGSMNQPFLGFMISIRQTTLTNYMSIVTIAGSLLTISAVTLAITMTWASYKHDLWRPILIVTSMLLAAAAVVGLKALIMTPRPLHSAMVPPFETYFAFPSGHVLGVWALLLSMGYLICSRRLAANNIIIWVITSLLITSVVAFSRLYLGYHWLTDISGSIGVGLIILSIIIVLDKLVTNQFARLQ